MYWQHFLRSTLSQQVLKEFNESNEGNFENCSNFTVSLFQCHQTSTSETKSHILANERPLLLTTGGPPNMSLTGETTFI